MDWLMWAVGGTVSAGLLVGCGGTGSPQPSLPSTGQPTSDPTPEPIVEPTPEPTSRPTLTCTFRETWRYASTHSVVISVTGTGWDDCQSLYVAIQRGAQRPTTITPMDRPLGGTPNCTGKIGAETWSVWSASDPQTAEAECSMVAQLP